MQNEENNEEMQTCPFCAEKIKIQAKKCRFCGEIIDPTLRMVNNLMNENKIHTELLRNKIQSQMDSKVFSDKTRSAYILFCIFLGIFGIHNFYAGYVGRGISQLLITILIGWLIIPLLAVAIWNLIELCVVNVDERGHYFS